MKKTLYAVLLVAVLTTLFVSCKKGENDPFISFRSRKHRMVNEWSCQKSTVRLTSLSGGITEIINISTSGASGSVSIYDPNSGTQTGTIIYSLKLNIKKDGTFTGIEMVNNQTNLLGGTWNFTAGIGKQEKNKESLMLYINNSTLSSLDGAFFAIGNIMTFEIKELKEKKLVLTIDKNIYTEGSDYNRITGEYTFE
jgi:hypothetical protein